MSHHSWRRWTWGAAMLLMQGGMLAAVPVQAKSSDAKHAYEALQDMIYDERYAQAYEAATRLLGAYPGSRYVEATEFWRCYALQRSSGDYARAFDCYKEFLGTHPDGKWSDDARAEYVKLAKKLSDAGDPRGKVILEGLAPVPPTPPAPFSSPAPDAPSAPPAPRTPRTPDVGMAPKGDRDFKLAVLYALMESGDKQVSLDSVTDLLKHSNDRDVRRNAVFMLSELDDPRVVDILLDVARNDPDPDVRRHAIYAVTDHADQDKVLDALVGIMKTEKDPDIRRHVLYAIAEVDRPEVTDALVGVALHDKDEDARRAATYALAEVNDDQATQALQKIVESDASDELRTAALYALIERKDVNIVPTLKKLATDKSEGPQADRLRRAAVYALAEVDDPSVVDALTEVVKTSVDSEVRKAAFYALAEHGGPEAENALRSAALDTQDESLAKAAVYGLADLLHDQDGAAFFMEVCDKSPFESVRQAALYAAIDKGGPASAGPLGKLLETEKNASQRRAIVWALADIETDESVTILARTAKKDPDRDVRHAAVQALGGMDIPAAKKALRDLLNESE